MVVIDDPIITLVRPAQFSSARVSIVVTMYVLLSTIKLDNKVMLPKADSLRLTDAIPEPTTYV